MIGIKERKGQKNNAAVLVRGKGSDPKLGLSHNLYGGYNACHKMRRNSPVIDNPAWDRPGDGNRKSGLQRPSVINFLQRNMGNSYIQSMIDRGTFQSKSRRSPDRKDISVSQDFSRDIGNGRPIDPGIAKRFRHGLGPFMDIVQIHHDGRSDELARREGAAAVTAGSHIYFAANAYQPHTAAGLNLISHELAHVLQQHLPNGPPPGYRSRPGDSFEQEADRIARTGTFLKPPKVIRITPRNSRQRRTAAQQIATVLRKAVEGWGTDEEAIFNALTGRTPAEITAIEAAYRALSRGESLEARLRDELSGKDLSRALSLLYGETAATEVARRLWDAMRGWGTDEEAIYAAVAGRTAGQWAEIQNAFQRMTRKNLLTELRDELTDSEWTYLNTLLPGAAGGAVILEDRATVIANRIEAAVAGPGTDEEAIYSALTGRSNAELREIEKRFKLLTGKELDACLRSELTDSEYKRVQRLLHPIPNPERLARRLHDAVKGPGTNESAIIAILTGRSREELVQIRAAYRRLYNEVLSERLEKELSGAELLEATILERAGLLRPEDEIKIAIKGLGTDEERLFAVLEELSGNRARIRDTIDRYRTRGYGDMLEDIRDDLSGSDLNRAMELLHGQTPTAGCTRDQRKTGLLAISGAVSLAQNAISKLSVDIGRRALSSKVKKALKDNFNPGNAANAVNIALAGLVRGVLMNTRNCLLMISNLTCRVLPPCIAQPVCRGRVVFATAVSVNNAAPRLVRLCPTFFKCLENHEKERTKLMLHEFVHVAGIRTANPRDEIYKIDPGFSRLTPRRDGTVNDSLAHADTYTFFAMDVS